MSQTITVVDAFTDRPFAGNPAAVCLLERPAPDAWMKNVAREMNLSETAFLHPIPGEKDTFGLRWLTPTVEVDLCGHATLASAHVLWESGRLQPRAIPVFRTRSGDLTARNQGDFLELDFPALPTESVAAPEGLPDALGAAVVSTHSTRMDLLVEIGSEADLRALRPNFSSLAKIPARGVIVTSRTDSGSKFDFVSRFFAPQSGIDEDPVTGSAHCALAEFWAPRLGKEAMCGFQASARGGVVRVRRENGRVKLGGEAVTVLRAELQFGPD